MQDAGERKIEIFKKMEKNLYETKIIRYNRERRAELRDPYTILNQYRRLSV